MNDNEPMSDNARLARIEAIGLRLRELTRITAKQNRFARETTHSTVVCKALNRVDVSFEPPCETVSLNFTYTMLS